KAGDCPTTVPLMKNRRGSDRIFGDVLQGAAAFDGMAFGPPTQHAAGEVGDVAKAHLPQNDGGLRGAAAGAADGDDRTIARQFAGAAGGGGERGEDRAPEGAQAAGG